jgi:hypothetical protein
MFFIRPIVGHHFVWPNRANFEMSVQLPSSRKRSDWVDFGKKLFGK